MLVEYTGHITIADDSGLEVDALDGAPGVHSARYAGENASDQDRIVKLLDTLQNVPNERRSGRFICAVAIAEPLAQVQVVRAACEGRIIRAPRGVSGFGYDPVFVPVGYDKTFAELGDEIKNQISHRAKALGEARELLSEIICEKRC
ncbi:dITP/XTP pyrophosphatase [Geodia barretti]|nr:dITP/XTP pyrophosphatase [Geodia barretti]